MVFLDISKLLRGRKALVYSFYFIYFLPMLGTQIFNCIHTFLCSQFFIFSLLCFSLVFPYFLFFRFFLFQYFTRENEDNTFHLCSRDNLLEPEYCWEQWIIFFMQITILDDTDTSKKHLIELIFCACAHSLVDSAK